MLTVTLKSPTGTLLPPIEIPAEVEAAGGAAIEAYVAGDAAARSAQVDTLRAAETARLKAAEAAAEAAAKAEADADAAAPAPEAAPAPVRRGSRSTSTQE